MATAHKKTPAKKATASRSAKKASSRPAAKKTASRSNAASKSTKPATKTAAKSKSSAGKATARTRSSGSQDEYTLSIPVERMARGVVDATSTPLAAARRALPSRDGLPVYLGLGGLAAIGAVGGPTAAAIGVGYAALRQWGPTRPLLTGEGNAKSR
ncbi:hypothetical protein [Streptomyces sp. BA2]|uniref:hypothetical protein n=1 Tax=Streptomyces sp. BA2 TaxID=436595 RepID=UPI00132A2419|nr:hypothetical protein [Streptomyces sp. BA2]MWA08477.1 hypothetical protein [Streptomyces sp. BA2]